MLEKLRRMREDRAEDDRGFTLIELLVVVVIIGILIAIAIPLYLNYENGAKNKSAQSDVRSAITTVEQCITDNGGTITGVTATGGDKADLVFTCGAGNTETARVGSNDKVTFAIDGAGSGFVLTGMSHDTSKTYTYTSATSTWS